MRLVLDTHPAVTLISTVKVARRDRVGKGEEGCRVAARRTQPLKIQVVLVFKHALRAFARDIAFAAADIASLTAMS